MSAAMPGPGEPWIDVPTLLQSPVVREAIGKAEKKATSLTPDPISQEYLDRLLARSVGMATEILFDLSGKRFTGKCGPKTIRPVARPLDADTLGLIYRGYGPNGYGIVGMGSSSAPPAISWYGVTYAPEIELPDFPIRDVLSVYIDGVLIPADEYELRDDRSLIRMRPTQSSVPTERYGWPTAQNLDIPDTQQGTFSITYTYGTDPGDGGRVACLKFAEVLACGALGDHSRYPERLQSISRQGVSMQVASVVDALKEKGTGIYEVDVWLLAVNPSRLRRRAVAWSPDRPAAPTQGRRYQ